MLEIIKNKVDFKKKNSAAWQQNSSFWKINIEKNLKKNSTIVDKVKAAISKIMLEKSEKNEKCNIIDIGFGSAWVAEFLFETYNSDSYNYIGLDIDPNFVETAEKKYSNQKNIRFHLADFENELPSQLQKSGDILLCLLSIIEMPHIDKVAKNLSKLVAVNGHIIITTLNPIVEIIRDSSSIEEIDKKLSSYFLLTGDFYISKKMQIGQNDGESEYYRILYSAEIILEKFMILNNNMKLVESDQIARAEPYSKNSPLFEFFLLKRNGK